MTALHRAVFVVSFTLALVWTVMLWKIMNGTKPKHRHRWTVIEVYPSGHQKSRCACGAVRLCVPPFKRSWFRVT